jgi:hypothetical protein
MQVKEHISQAVQDLQLPHVVKPIQLLVTGSASTRLAMPEERRMTAARHVEQHDATCTRAYKLLAEANMEMEPRDVHAAMRAFSKALPSLPLLGKVVASQEDGISSAADAKMPQDVANELMKVYSHTVLHTHVKRFIEAGYDYTLAWRLHTLMHESYMLALTVLLSDLMYD